MAIPGGIDGVITVQTGPGGSILGPPSPYVPTNAGYGYVPGTYTTTFTTVITESSAPSAPYNYNNWNGGAYVNVLQMATGNKNNEGNVVNTVTQECISQNTGYWTGSASTVGTWDFSGFTGNTANNVGTGATLNLQIVVDGTDNQRIDGQVQIFNLTDCATNGTGTWVENLYKPTTVEICNYIQCQIDGSNGTLGGFIPVALSTGQLRFDTRHAGENAAIIVKPVSSANQFFNFDCQTKYGVTLSGTGNSTANGLIYGAANNTTNPMVSFRLTADSPGIEGNNTSVILQNINNENIFNVTVFSNGIQVESWGGLTMDPTSSRYVGTYLPIVSNYLGVQVPSNVSSFNAYATGYSQSPNYSQSQTTAQIISNNPVYFGAPPANGTYLLGSVSAGLGQPNAVNVGIGSDGIPGLPDDQDTLLRGNAVGFTGLYGLSDPEQIDIDLIAIPGHSSTAVVEELINFISNYRQDCLGIVDPPFGLTVQEIISWQNGSHPLNNVRFDSDFLALYWPWVNIYDDYNNINVWAPPSGSIMAVYARSDDLSAPWFAPAGETRGIVPGIVDVFNRPTLAERDAMYGNFNCINPIVQFSNLTNFVVWGQKTMQRLPSALDRVNVRRCMFVIEKEIRQASRHMLFDPNDAIFEAKFVSMCSTILDAIKVGRGIYDYKIVADASVNTPDVMDRNEFRANIGIQPEKAVEFMFLTFSVNKTGDFTQSSNY